MDKKVVDIIQKYFFPMTFKHELFTLLYHFFHQTISMTHLIRHLYILLDILKGSVNYSTYSSNINMKERLSVPYESI